MKSQLVQWMLAPDSRRGLHFARDDGPDWDTYTYEVLAQLAAGTARQLRFLSPGRNAVVALLLPTGPDFAAAFFGALAAGGTPCALAPPGFLTGWDEYVAHAAGILRAAEPALFVTDASLAAVAEEVAQAAGTRPPVTLTLTPSEEVRLEPVPELALLQFTSGSSGTPRGVRVSHDNLQSNIAAIRRWLRMGRDDGTATWLPLHHDMGLIGCLLTPIANQSDVWIMRPDQFVRDPMRWVRCFGDGSAVLTSAPNFGYAFAARRIDPAALSGLDFAAWRAAIVGAERIEPLALASFAGMLRPFGFRSQAFRPAYGLAEATLMVTGLPLGSTARAVRLRWERLRVGKPVEVVEVRPADDPAIGDGAEWLVGSGGAQLGAGVEIVDDAGVRLPEPALGEILATGRPVASGYQRGSPASATAFTEAGLRTGDAGFLLDGELFVAGRIADSLKVRGRPVYAEQLEAWLAAVPGVPAGRSVVVVGPGPAHDRVVALVESTPGPWQEAARDVLRREVGPAEVQVVAVRRGAIPRTSSGKPRRRLLWRALVDDQLEQYMVSSATEPNAGARGA